jgi:hypothetical protein
MNRPRALSIAVMCIAAWGCAIAAPAGATSPSREIIPMDYSFTPPQLSAHCGFAVTRHVVGTLTIHTFLDGSGNLVRELDRYQLVETLSADGPTLVGRTSQTVTVAVAADGSYTVAVAGPDFRLSLPGAGVSFGSVGRLLLSFAADDTLLGVVQDVGMFE